jgi:hypothetical protein
MFSAAQRVALRITGSTVNAAASPSSAFTAQGLGYECIIDNR